MLSASAFAACTGSSPTWTASADQTSVNTCISNASPGDTVNVAAGSATWSSVTWSGKKVILAGVSTAPVGNAAGTSSTHITVSGGGAVGFDSCNGCQITGFDFEEGTGTNYLQITNSINFRVNNNTVNRGNWDIGVLIFGGFSGGVYTPVEGLFDHNTFTYTRLDLQGEDTSRGGRDAWALPLNAGTQHAIYVEQNTANFPDGSTAGSYGNFTDGNLGCRYVVRFNTMVGARFESHGLQGENQDGCQLFEYYDNTMTTTNSAVTSCTISGGTATATLASVTGFSVNGQLHITGNTNTNCNVDTAAITGVNTGANTITFAASGSGSGTGGTASLPNFRPFFIRGGTGFVFHNTYDSLYLDPIIQIDTDRANENSIASQVPNWEMCDGLTQSVGFASPKTVIIDGAGAGGYPCRDQLGAATTGSVWGYTTTPPAQTLQGAYFWKNTETGVGEAPVSIGCETSGNALCLNQAANILIQNRDFYTYNASFNGTSGVGEGTLASRPSTCTKGVGYWATDQGSWNQSGSGGQGQFYQCSSTNTWTLLYTPLTFPNPLQGAPAASTPTFSPVAGTYTTTQSVTISTTSAGAIICYNTTGSPATNGTTGCSAGTLYSGPVSVASNETLFAVAGGTGFSDSSIGSAAYVIAPVVATPTFSPIAGTYSSTQSITITSSTTGATLCYTTDGTTPTANGTGTCTHGTTYTTPVSVTSSLTLKAVGSKSGDTDSSVGSAAYIITTSPPPAKGVFAII